MKLLAIDPGPHTGIAIRHEDGSYSVQTLNTEDTALAVWELIAPPLDGVIIERFAAQLISSYGLNTVEIVGGVRALCYYHHLPFYIHSPQHRLPWQDIAKKEARALDKHCTIHAIEALAHLFCYEYRALGVDHHVDRSQL